jgi:thiol-disulfide isomerase/thioredoxin
MKKVFILICLIISSVLWSQKIIEFSEIEYYLKCETKPLLVYFYTDWCGICQIQTMQIEKDKELIEFLETQVFFVKFNADSTKEFELKGEFFQKSPSTYHDILFAIFDNAHPIHFPAWVVLTPDFEVVFQYFGLLSVKELKSIILKME